ncbi:MAG: hypothetical protein H0U04_07015 [Rubrobacter sp.]|nr:hypothetical protein [Rubrobacter sp.]
MNDGLTFRHHSSSRIAWSLWCLAMVFFVASLVLRLWNGSALTSSLEGLEYLEEIIWWDVLLLNRTLVYGLLTAMLALVYVGSVVALQYGFRTFTGGGSQLAVVASTLVIAALFNPLRRRTQDFIDRRFYRKKYDAQQVLAVFSARLRDETNLDGLSSDLAKAVRDTVQPAHMSLWLRPPDRGVKP